MSARQATYAILIALGPALFATPTVSAQPSKDPSFYFLTPSSAFEAHGIGMGSSMSERKNAVMSTADTPATTQPAVRLVERILRLSIEPSANEVLCLPSCSTVPMRESSKTEGWVTSTVEPAAVTRAREGARFRMVPAAFSFGT